MLTVETLGKIRRDHFVHGKSIKAIARDLGVSRNTVRKALRSEETEFSYERTMVARPKLGPYEGRLDALLEENAGKGLRAAGVRARRSLPVRLVARDRGHRRGDDDGEGGARAAVPLADDVRSGVSAGEPGDGIRRPQPGVRVLPGRLLARDLRQHEDGRGGGVRGQGAGVQPSLRAAPEPLSGRAGGVHPGRRLGEGPGREPGGDDA